MGDRARNLSPGPFSINLGLFGGYHRKLPNTDNEQDKRMRFTKFDRNVPDDFLSARHNEINEYINTLEGDVTTQ